MSHAKLLESVAQLARDVGEVILQMDGTDFHVHGKDDASSVTEADERAEAVILAGLARLAPGVPVVAEQSVAVGRIPDIHAAGGRFWLVDPPEGTKEFLQRIGEFTLNIALIEGGDPVLGVVLAPRLGVSAGGGRGLARIFHEQ